MTYQDVKNIAGKLGWNVSIDEECLNFCFCGKKDFFLFWQTQRWSLSARLDFWLIIMKRTSYSKKS